MITVNGKTMKYEEETCLASLLHQLGFSDRPCAVEVNMELVPHNERESFELSSGDSIEIVTLVGGG